MQWIDSKLWNVLLQNGKIILFDWHMGIIREGELPSSNATNSAEDPQKNRPRLPFGHKYLNPGEMIHDYDTYEVASLIKEYLSNRKSAVRRGNQIAPSWQDVQVDD